MKLFFITISFFLLQVTCKGPQKLNYHDRYVKGNTLISTINPRIMIEANQEFRYIGYFDFEIKANSDEYPAEYLGKKVADSYRFVFANADKNIKIRKLFIVQFEGFLPKNNFKYNYNFDAAENIGNIKYRHNTWFYDNEKNVKENPGNEGAKTLEFLKSKGYVLEPDFMMSRYVGLASEDRKNEIIIFYIEMLKNSTGYSLNQYENSINKDKADSIRKDFVSRSKKSFIIKTD